ncbi:MAG: helix-turn-helix domain-containing protein [Clostridia bacterium]|nr:helix-turn-helix domain-containing protein [Clostridia bacterium]
MKYISAGEAAEKWGVTVRRVQTFCEQGRIKGQKRFGRMWMIPENAEKPSDPRNFRRRAQQAENRN